MLLCCCKTSASVAPSSASSWNILWLDSPSSSTLSKLRKEEPLLFKNVSETYTFAEFSKAIKTEPYRRGNNWCTQPASHFDIAIVLDWQLSATKIERSVETLFNELEQNNVRTIFWISKKSEAPLTTSLRSRLDHVIHSPRDPSFLFALQNEKRGLHTRAAVLLDTTPEEGVILLSSSVTGAPKEPEPHPAVLARSDDTKKASVVGLEIETRFSRSTKKVSTLATDPHTTSPASTPYTTLHHPTTPIGAASSGTTGDIDILRREDFIPAPAIATLWPPSALIIDDTRSQNRLLARSSAGITPLSATPLEFDPGSPNFLLLEDTRVIGRTASRILRKYGNVYWINQSQSALNALMGKTFTCYNPITEKHDLPCAPTSFALALIDFQLEGDTRSGREVVQEFRTLETAILIEDTMRRKQPIFTFTTDYYDSATTPLSEEDAASFDGIFSKPINNLFTDIFMLTRGFRKRGIRQSRSLPSRSPGFVPCSIIEVP